MIAHLIHIGVDDFGDTIHYSHIDQATSSCGTSGWQDSILDVSYDMLGY